MASLKAIVEGRVKKETDEEREEWEFACFEVDHPNYKINIQEFEEINHMVFDWSYTPKCPYGDCMDDINNYTGVEWVSLRQDVSLKKAVELIAEQNWFLKPLSPNAAYRLLYHLHAIRMCLLTFANDRKIFICIPNESIMPINEKERNELYSYCKKCNIEIVIYGGDGLYRALVEDRIYEVYVAATHPAGVDWSGERGDLKMRKL